MNAKQKSFSRHLFRVAMAALLALMVSSSFAQDIVKIEVSDPSDPELQAALAKAGDLCYTVNENDFKVDQKTRKRYPWLKKTMAVTTYRFLKRRLKCSPSFGEFGVNRIKGRAYNVGKRTRLQLTVVNYKDDKFSLGDIVTGTEKFTKESPLLILDRLVRRSEKYLWPAWKKKAGSKLLKKKKFVALQFNVQAKNGAEIIKFEKGQYARLSRKNKKLIKNSKKKLGYKENLNVSMPENPFVSFRTKNPRGLHRLRMKIISGVKSSAVLDLGRFGNVKKLKTLKPTLHVFYEHDVAKDMSGDDGSMVATGVTQCVGIDYGDFYVAPNAQKAYPWLAATFPRATHMMLNEALTCDVPTKGLATHKITGAAFVVQGKLRIELGIAAFKQQTYSKEDIVNAIETYTSESPLLLMDKAFIKSRQFIPAMYKKSAVDPELVDLEKVQLNISLAVNNMGKTIYPKVSWIKVRNVAYPVYQEEVTLEENTDFTTGGKPYMAGDVGLYKGFNEVNLNILDPEKTKMHLVLGIFKDGQKVSRPVLPVFINFKYWNYQKWKLPYLKKEALATSDTSAEGASSTSTSTSTATPDAAPAPTGDPAQPTGTSPTETPDAAPAPAGDAAAPAPPG